MANIKVAIINASTVLSDDEVKKVGPELQTQVDPDFAQAWGTDADLNFVPKNSSPPAGAWWLVVLDNSDVAGALGYHDLTDQGFPLGKVFAGTDMNYGLQWTITASHELLEMLADPDINLAAYVEHDKRMTLYAYEVCDACEADKLGYNIDGTMVSDFVYPAWFESFRKKGSTRFDYGNQVQKPFQLLPGGYISIYEVPAGNGWTQITGEREPLSYAMRARVGSRRERRWTPRADW